MLKVSDVTSYLEELAPIEIAEHWDNVGLLVGDKNATVKRILITLDVSWEVINEAISREVDLIISHHPLIFGKINKVTSDNSLTQKIITLIQNNINVYSAHTNLDLANGGVNDILVKKINLSNIENLCEYQEYNGNKYALGRVGTLNNDMTLKEFANIVRNALNLESVRYIGDQNMTVKKVAVLGGSGAERSYFAQARQKGCDVYLTGDLKYHNAQEALETGLAVVDGTHYSTEYLIVGELHNYLKKKFEGLEIYETIKNSNIIQEA